MMMTGRTIRAIGIIAMALMVGYAAPIAAQEDEMSADEIVQKANEIAYYQGKDGRSRVNMKIVDSQGRERNRELIILRRDSRPDDESKKEDFEQDEYTGDQRFYVYFVSPSDWEKSVFLVWKHVQEDKADDRWLYLPAMDLTKRISAGDERSSFAGSHFFYEDISGRTIPKDEHELERTTDTYYVLKNTPKKPDMVEFKYYKMYIHKDSFLPTKVEYFDNDDEKYREYVVESVEKVQGYLTVTKAKMVDVDSGGHTTVEYEDIEYNSDIPKDIFSKRYLQNAPSKHLKLN